MRHHRPLLSARSTPATAVPHDQPRSSAPREASPVVRGGTARGLVLGLTLAFTGLLGACSGSPSNGDLTDGINAWIGQRPVCWSVANGSSTNFPLHASLPADEINAAHQPILNGLMNGGYITLGRPASQGFEPASALDIALTDKGDEAHVWDPEHGFCVGTRTVDSIERFSDPEKDVRHNTRVRYTWRLSGVPGWAVPALFTGVPGLVQPVEAEAVLHKVNGRWQVESEGPVKAPENLSTPEKSTQ